MLWARTLSGATCGAYFLTGRSPASRSRVLLRGDDKLIVAPAGEHDYDPLRHYAAVCERGGWLDE